MKPLVQIGNRHFPCMFYTLLGPCSHPHYTFSNPDPAQGPIIRGFAPSIKPFPSSFLFRSSSSPYHHHSQITPVASLAICICVLAPISFMPIVYLGFEVSNVTMIQRHDYVIIRFLLIVTRARVCVYVCVYVL